MNEPGHYLLQILFSRLIEVSLIEFSSQFTSKQLNDGATKFQSLYRGYITRKYTIFPNPVLNLCICKQINAFIKSSKRQLVDVTSEINEGKKFFIKWDKNHKILSLVFPNEDIVGSGFWKKIFSSNTIKIPLTTKKKEIKQFESVWIIVDDKTANEIRIQEIFYKQFIKEAPKGVFFLEPWEQIHHSVYTQRRLINKLQETKFNDPFQKFHCMRDLARTLTWIHQQGMVHGDVHLKNILFEERIDDEGLFRLVAYLTDFGSAKMWGADQNRKLDDYVRWDCCKCFADINTPLVDWHGFIITNIVTWFPEMTSHLKWKKFISIRQMVFLNESTGNSVSDTFYWVGYKPFTDLTPMEQQAWHLFIAICKKSTQLYLHFKNHEGEISKEEVEKAVVEVKICEVISECLQFVEKMGDYTKSLALP